jgi:hypothetical protein
VAARKPLALTLPFGAGPLIASVAAIAVSPLLMLLTGQDAFYTLWLTVMMIGLWAAQRLTRRELGIAVGDSQSYLIALAYPVGIIGCVALGAWAAQKKASFEARCGGAARGPGSVRRRPSSGRASRSACGTSPCRLWIRTSHSLSSRCRNGASQSHCSSTTAVVMREARATPAHAEAPAAGHSSD